MEPTHGNEQVVTSNPAPQGTPAPAAAPESPAPAAAAPEAPAPKIETSPAAQKAREAIDNAKKGIFPKEKETKTPETKASDKDPASKEPAKDPAAPAAAAAPETPPAYVANHKYKVNGVEKQFDDSIKALIKDKATEEKVRKLYADAEGIVPLKKDFDRVAAQHKEVSQKYGLIDRDLRLLSHHVKNEDFDSFFADLQIPEDKILGWVERKLAHLQLPPAIQAQIESQRNAQRTSFMLQEENQGYQQNIQTQAVQARTYELDMELLKPDVAQQAQEFDARVGRPGAFRDECMNRGALAWHFGKKDIPAAEAVGQVISLIGRVVTPPPPAADTAPLANTPAGARPQGGTAPVLPPPTIPNLSGSTTSPIKQAPRSIADLRNLSKTFPATR